MRASVHRRSWPLCLAFLLCGCTAADVVLDREASDEITKPLATDPSWGSWSAEAGATNVTGPRVLHVEGTSPVRVRFVEPEFRGVDDPRWTVPIAGNLVMGWGPPRGELRWTDGPSVVLPLGPGTPELVVNYRIRQVPDVLLAQEYRADYVLENVD